MKTPSISKSKYLNGLQCPKLLWAQYNAKDWFPSVDAATQALFDTGHVVGDLAKKLYPKGVEVPWTESVAETLAATKPLVALRKPIFEASIMAGGAYARADILNPVGRSQWDIIEVKSSTEVKDVYVPDLALQQYCYEQGGLPIRRCYLMHINNQYVLDGDVDPSGVFAKEDITDRVKELLPSVGKRLKGMAGIINQKNCPEQDIGPHCSDPYTCPLMDRCWKHVSRYDDNIFTLRRVGGKIWPLYQQGILRNRNVGNLIALSNAQEIQIRAERTGEAYVNPQSLKQFLASLEYPLHFFDFETFQTAIPMVQRTRPFQQIPFQFSLHVVKQPKGELQHHSWIWDGTGDPFRIMLESLDKTIQPKGSIVTYNATFEKTRLKEAAERHQDWQKKVKGWTSRIVDLMAPFQQSAVYHPEQHGSNSLKAVLPALTRRSYDGMAIANGGAASQAFVGITFGHTTKKEKQETLKALERYCGQDTSGLWDILQALSHLVQHR